MCKYISNFVLKQKCFLPFEVVIMNSVITRHCLHLPQLSYSLWWKFHRQLLKADETTSNMHYHLRLSLWLLTLLSDFFMISQPST